MAYESPASHTEYICCVIHRQKPMAIINFISMVVGFDARY